MKIEVEKAYYMLEKREMVLEEGEEEEPKLKLKGITLIDTFDEAVKEISSLVEQGISAENMSLFKVEIGEKESKANPISWATIFQELHKPKENSDQA